MHSYSGLMGFLYELMEWIMRLAIVNLLWATFNLPLLFLVFSVLFVPLEVGFVMHIVLIVLLAPLLLFPSTSAAFATIRDWIMNKEQSSVMKAYVVYFKENYKNSMQSGIILTFIWLVWFIDFYYFFGKSDVVITILFIVGIVLFVYTINLFSLSVHFRMSLRKLFLNTFFTTIGSPLLFFFVLMSNALVFYISFRKLWFLVPFFIVSISIFLSFYSFYRFTLRVEEKI